MIDAPLDRVHTIIRDFKIWPKWSPWLIAEPNATLTYQPDGNGYSWRGNIVGAGNVTVTREDGKNAIFYNLQFFKPFKSLNKTSFLLEQHGTQVQVTWTMDGSLPFFLFFLKNMIVTMTGMDFERGLKMLKDLVELAEVPCELEFPGEGQVAGFRYLGIEVQCPISDIQTVMSKDFERLKSAMAQHGIAAAGVPFTIYSKWCFKTHTCGFTMGYPVSSLPREVPEGMVTGDLPDLRTYQVKMTGPYRHLGNAWSAGMFHGRAKIYRQKRGVYPFETYQRTLDDGPEEEAVTVVHFPVV